MGKKKWASLSLGGGDYTQSEVAAIYNKRKDPNSLYNKKHFDKVLRNRSVLSTLSYDANRTKDADMFYATYKKADKDLYNATMRDKNISRLATIGIKIINR